ncbi:MAG TPA: hypothetical protein O0X42_03195 [Methanocorpusculum sp.]|nr:hypothetical protein [Methanocorpusculum sp.]
MELKHERVMIKSFSDIPKLSKKYNRILKLALVAQEQEVTGRFNTTCIRGVGYLSVDSKTHIENKSDNHVYLSAVSTEQYGIIKNVNDLDAVMDKNYRAPKDHHAKNWKELRDYLEMQCGRADHVYGYAELRPTQAQIKAVVKSASKQMPDTKKTGNGKKRTTQQTLSTKTQKQRVTQKSYKPRKGTTQKTGYTSNIIQDKTRHARPVGRRISRNGNVYYEYRDNRSDTEKELYEGMSVLDKKTLKILGEHGIIYYGGELVTPQDKRKTKKLSEKELLEVVKSYERKIHKRPIENLLYFDECGNVISHSVGNGVSVHIDREMEGICAANTHNHPYSNLKPAPQSDQDVKVFLKYGAPIARVCSYGVTYQYKKGRNYNKNKLSAEEISMLTKTLKNQFLEMQKDLFIEIGEYLHIRVIVKKKGGKLELEFKNVFNLPLNLYSRAITKTYEIYGKRMGIEMVKIHRDFADILKKDGVDILFTVGDL